VGESSRTFARKRAGRFFLELLIGNPQAHRASRCPRRTTDQETAMEHALSYFTPGGLGFALGLTLMAGLATGLGSALAFFAKRTNLRLLSWSLAFSAGAMLCVSFMEILPKANASLARSFGSSSAGWLATLGFFAGITVMAIIDALVPHADNPHELRSDADLQRLKAPGHATVVPTGEQRLLRRMGLFTALAVAIHNFPEGVATFLAAIEDPPGGVAIAFAVALHNIPEGVSVSAPIFYATGRRGRAFVYSFLSGLTEPLGGLFAAVTLDWLLAPHAVGLVFASVAGVMVYVSLHELVPTARQYGRSHEVLAAIAGGMAVMAVSLLLLH
jgi:ZIP family zinc transporter